MEEGELFLSYTVKKKNIAVIFFVGIIFFARLFVFQPIEVSGVSMEPTLYSGERGIVLKKETIQRNDIVCFWSKNKSDDILIKRIIGVEGDQITLLENTIFVNGVEIEEDYLIDYPFGSNVNGLHEEVKGFTVPTDSFYMLGDNRIISLDSRKFGFVPKENVIGKLIFSFGIKSY